MKAGAVLGSIHLVSDSKGHHRIVSDGEALKAGERMVGSATVWRGTGTDDAGATLALWDKYGVDPETGERRWWA